MQSISFQLWQKVRGKTIAKNVFSIVGFVRKEEPDDKIPLNQ